jgi:hypothetical protein
MVTCDTCDETYHESCLAYYETYECEECAEDPAVGLQEL